MINSRKEMDYFHQDVINNIRPFVLNAVNVMDVISDMTCLSQNEREEVESRRRNTSNSQASALLLEILYRHSADAFIQFYFVVKKQRPKIAALILEKVPPVYKRRFQKDGRSVVPVPNTSSRGDCLIPNPSQSRVPVEDPPFTSLEDNTKVEIGLDNISQDKWTQIEKVINEEYSFQQLFQKLSRRLWKKTQEFRGHDPLSHLIDLLAGENWTIKDFVNKLVEKIENPTPRHRILQILRAYLGTDKVLNVEKDQSVPCQSDKSSLLASKNADMDGNNLRQEQQQQQRLFLPSYPTREQPTEQNPSQEEETVNDFEPDFDCLPFRCLHSQDSVSSDHTAVKIPDTELNIPKTSKTSSGAARPKYAFDSTSELKKPYHQTSLSSTKGPSEKSNLIGEDKASFNIRGDSGNLHCTAVQSDGAESIRDVPKANVHCTAVRSDGAESIRDVPEANVHCTSVQSEGAESIRDVPKANVHCTAVKSDGAESIRDVPKANVRCTAVKSDGAESIRDVPEANVHCTAVKSDGAESTRDVPEANVHCTAVKSDVEESISDVSGATVHCTAVKSDGAESIRDVPEANVHCTAVKSDGTESTRDVPEANVHCTAVKNDGTESIRDVPKANVHCTAVKSDGTESIRDVPGGNEHCTNVHNDEDESMSDVSGATVHCTAVKSDGNETISDVPGATMHSTNVHSDEDEYTSDVPSGNVHSTNVHSDEDEYTRDVSAANEPDSEDSNNEHLSKCPKNEGVSPGTQSAGTCVDTGQVW